MRPLAIVLTVVMLVGAVACNSSVSTAAAGPYETKSTQGVIAFDLTPREPAEGRFTVDIRANTHSGDLADLDLRKVAALEAAGRTYRPVEATSLSGHHSAGSITFEIQHVPEHFAVTLTGVRNMGTLRFEWP